MIGSRIKRFRIELHLTQEELAKKLGVTASSVGMYEANGRYYYRVNQG